MRNHNNMKTSTKESSLSIILPSLVYYQQDLYIGVAVNTFDLNFKQRSILSEQNNDGAGTVLNAAFYQENNTLGTGFSLSAGLIYKATKKLRLGFSYQTPIWFTKNRRRNKHHKQ